MQELAEELIRGAAPPSGLRRLAGWSRSLVVTHPLAAAGVAIAVIIGGLYLAARRPTGDPAWAGGRPESVIVLPFEEPASSVEDRALAMEMANILTRELFNWNGLRTMSAIDLAGPRARRGLDDQTLARTDDGIGLARDVDAQAMIALSAVSRGDSVIVQAGVFDARSGRRAGPPMMLRWSSQGTEALGALAPVVAEVLGLVGAPEPRRILGAGTRDPLAAKEYLHGLDELGRSRLEAAEVRFRNATARDSTFGAALAFLGQSLFWQGVQSGALPRLGPEISQASTLAMRHVALLSPQNAGHVRAFYALQGGDFSRARELYGAILAAYPDDLFAWVMLGEVDILDSWLDGSGGRRLPRSDLNRGREAFATAVRLQPSFELAYGQLFTIQRIVESPLLQGGCPVFEDAPAEVVPVWQVRVVTDRIQAFCPVAAELIEWIPKSQFDAADKEPFRAGADRLFREAVRELERWVSLAPTQPRPLDMLSTAYLTQRFRPSIAAPERTRELAASALRYKAAALALQTDTLPADLADLSSLLLAAGQPRAAVEYAERALAHYPPREADGAVIAPRGLTNALVYAGRTGVALAIASGYTGTQYQPDPAGGEPIALQGAEAVIERLRVLGATGVTGAPLAAELVMLREVWMRAGVPPRDQQVLANGITLRIAGALAMDSANLVSWSQGVTVANPLWRALVASYSQPEVAAVLLRAAIDTDAPGVGATRPFLLGLIASKVGLHEEAIRHYARLDSIPHIVDGFDIGWGLQVVSFLLRAEDYERLGDTRAARAHFERFIEARFLPDSLAQAGIARASAGLARVSNDVGVAR
jgi:tetratricopeptide (TPR) repeat protein